MVINMPAMQEIQVQSLGRKDPWRREWQPIPVFLPGEFHEEEPGRLQSMGSQRVLLLLLLLSHVSRVRLCVTP